MKNNTIALLVGIFIVVLIWGILVGPEKVAQITGYSASSSTATLNMSDEVSILVTGAVNFGAGRVYANSSYAVLDSELNTNAYESPLALWRFDRANGSNSTFTPDLTGRFNLTVVNATNTTGKINEAYKFSLYKYLRNSFPTIPSKDELTFGAWANADQLFWTGTSHFIVRHNNNFWLRAEIAPTFFDCSVYTVINVTNQTIVKTVSNFSPVNNIWYHLVCVYNGTNVKMYVNGVLNNVSDTFPLRNLSHNSGTLDFGTAGSYFWNGTIDEGFIFNRTLSDDEIYRIYNESDLKMGGSWFFNKGYISVQNDGTVNISINFSANKDASQFIGGSNPSFKIKGVVNETGACPALNTTYDEVLTNPKTICPLFKYQNDADRFKVPVRLIVPDDASSGVKNSTITFTATQVS